MSDIDPAFYRTELGLAVDGDWYLMRDGKVLAALPPGEGCTTLTSVTSARLWATAELASRGIPAGEWLNGMDLPEPDSGYWVTEPHESEAAA